MIEHLKFQFKFYILLLLWVAIGMYGDILVYGFIPLILVLFRMNERYQEIFLGFVLILVISDNLEPQLAFAKTFKNLNIVLLFAFFISDLNNFKPVNRLFVAFVPFFLMAVFCLFYAGPNFSSGIQKTLSYILLFIAVPNYVTKNYSERGVDFLKNLLYLLLLLIIVGYLLRFVSLNIAFSHGGRFRGLFGNPNGLGIFCILAFVLFAVVDGKFDDAFTRYDRILFYSVILLAVFLTGSRTALLAIVLFVIFKYIYSYSPFLGFILFIVSIMATEYLTVNFIPLVKSLGLSSYFRLDTLDQGSGRLVAWEFAWQNIQKSLLVGKGFAYDEYLMRASAGELTKLGHEGGVHNTYLIIWLNTGLIGLLLFLRGMLVMFFRAAKNNAVAFPVLFTIFFSINFEPWLAASLNPYTILFLTVLTIMTDPVINEETEEVTSEELIENENETSAEVA